MGSSEEWNRQISQRPLYSTIVKIEGYSYPRDPATLEIIKQIMSSISNNISKKKLSTIHDFSSTLHTSMLPESNTEYLE